MWGVTISNRVRDNTRNGRSVVAPLPRKSECMPVGGVIRTLGTTNKSMHIGKQGVGWGHHHPGMALHVHIDTGNGDKDADIQTVGEPIGGGKGKDLYPQLDVELNAHRV